MLTLLVLQSIYSWFADEAVSPPNESNPMPASDSNTNNEISGDAPSEKVGEQPGPSDFAGASSDHSQP